MFHLKKATLVLIIFLLPVLAFAYKGKIIQSKVMQVKDGDTVVIAPVDRCQFFVCRLTA